MQVTHNWSPLKSLSTHVWNEPEIGNSLNTVPYNSDVMNQNSGVKAEHCHVEPIRTLLLMELTDRIGMLHDILRFFWKHDVNVTRIESRPRQLDKFDFFVDLEGSIGDDNVDKLLDSLKAFGVQKLLILDKKEGKSMNAACLCYVF
jgi:hypothetical protein